MNTLFFRLSSAFFLLIVTCQVSAQGDTSASLNQPVTEQQLAPPSNPLITHDLSPMGMYHAADWVVKAVMISLLLASIACWAVFFTKQIQVMFANQRTRKLLANLVVSESLTDAEHALSQHKGNEIALITAAQHEMHMSSLGATSEDGIKERVQLRLERVQAELGRKMTSLTGVLATIGSVSPFVGLFGTVWGIMNAFIGIAKAKSTTLVVVAPGIAEALLATAIGLIAAIPAVMMYNYFTRYIAKYKALVADTSVATMVLVSRDLDRQQGHSLTPELKKVV
ncbi:TonB-system energizer ExbB type-1 [Vibrio sinaloensis DSM 21326]|uniref:Biopolymer transport protein ExbB n=1 Tax=Vibrio sinaloensis DSM 21326 TaxID=945550 RepID=E8M5P6_PHOS4|nr:tonB-system energizer ExbB [Vibrio sinaloensis]EGA70618.1 TonB-system energizer ExbB type-1 [Vibrio sinaloensis DSM 21326]